MRNITFKLRRLRQKNVPRRREINVLSHKIMITKWLERYFVNTLLAQISYAVNKSNNREKKFGPGDPMFSGYTQA